MQLVARAEQQGIHSRLVEDTHRARQMAMPTSRLEGRPRNRFQFFGVKLEQLERAAKRHLLSLMARQRGSISQSARPIR